MSDGKVSIFTPLGGANQDDSLNTPSQDAAGHSLFETGDYRYALNARIGSSRGSNFGDVENLKGTTSKPNYYALEQILDNSDFEASLASWSQIDEGGDNPWLWNSGSARLSLTPDSVTPTLYYNVTSFTAPTDSGSWPSSGFTQANFAEAGTYSVGQSAIFSGSIIYLSGYIVFVGVGYFVFQHSYAGNDTGVQVAYGSGPPEYISTNFRSKIIYQTSPEDIQNLIGGLLLNAVVNGAISDGQVILYFLNAETILSQQTIYLGNIISFLYSNSFTFPDTCDGVGFRVMGTIIEPVTFDLNYFKLTLMQASTVPVGTEKVIGRYEDNEFQRIYLCVWNSNNDHTIRYFDPNTENTYELLRWSGLSFGSDYFVKMAKLDNWIALADRNNAPRLIDTDSISSLFLSLTSDNFREFHISFHKWAPTIPPIPRVYYDNVTNNYDKLKNKVYQFAYRYIYYGNLRSRWSPVSKGAITTVCGYYYTPTGSPTAVSQLITSIEVDIPGGLYDDPSSSTDYNYFDHSDLKFKSAVKSIELAFREGELELWKQWKTVPTNNFSRYQYFDGKATLTPLSQDDFDQPFDTVPFIAGTVEAVDNRFVFADILDEQEPATGLVVDDISVVDETIDHDWQDAFKTSFPLLSQRDDLIRRNSLSNFNFKDRGTYKLGIQWLHKTGWRSALYTTDDFIYNTEDTSITSVNRPIGFSFVLNVIPPEWAVGFQIFRTNVLNIDGFIYGIANKFLPLIDDVSVILDQVNLPDNIKDRIRQHFENSRIIVGDELINQVEIEVNAAISADKKKNKNRNNILKANERFGKPASPLTGGINNFQNKQLTRYLKSNPISGKLIPELRKTKTILLIANASRIYIDINNWYFGSKNASDKENQLNKLFYNYREGDRVRFIGSEVASPTLESQLKEYDVPIIEFTGKGIIIEKPVGMLYMQTAGVPTGFAHYNLEIYTPKIPSEADHILYEVGEWYPVLYPGTENRVLSKTDFTYTGNSAVTVNTYGPFNFFNKLPFYYGDCYTIPKTVYRDTYAVSPAVAENAAYGSSGINLSMNPDPDKTFDYWDKCNGRGAVTYQNLPIAKFKGTLARFGGKIIEQSYVNYLNNFLDEDQYLYPSEYGTIRNLINTSNAQVESVGSILLALGEREAWSIYVNRTTLEDLSGNTQVSISDQVLGSYNTLLGAHGTLNPESVSKYRGNVYYWDALNGSWIRYGRDGLTPISDNKKRNWFKELGMLLMPKYFTDEKPHIISEFDPFNMELVTFMDHSSLPSTFRGYTEYKGDTFSENDKRWKMCHSYQPEMFAKMNNQLYSFKGGIIYAHETSEQYDTFYGVKYDSKIEPVFNSGNMKISDITDVKTWLNLGTLSTDGWSVERILSEYRGNKNTLESRIALSSFELKEDTYWAAIKKDLNTPNIANPLIEGRAMKSKAIQVLFKLDPSVDYLSLLHYAFAKYIESEINP